MAITDGSEPIDDAEVLYRRIPDSKGWYDAGSPPSSLSPDAFRPTENDTTGLSLSRAKYKSVEDAALGRPGKTFWVAKLLAGEMRLHGIELVPRPLPGDPGHAEIPSMTYPVRKSAECEGRTVLLAGKLTLEIFGPFTTPLSEES